MVGELALDHVSWVQQRTVQRIRPIPVLALGGDIQQRLGRGSYEIELGGVLVGEGVRDSLSALQEKVAAGDEVDFTSDITSALELDKVIVVAAEFREHAGQPNHYDYALLVRESPPLPEPAELSPFGGLDGFDLGFDTDILGDIADIASDVQAAVEAVTDAIDQLSVLAGLADLAFGNPLTPIQEQGDSIASAGGAAAEAAEALSRLLGGGG